MMGNLYLAIDISEVIGRHILGRKEDGKLILEEVYNFDIKYIDKDGTKYLDMEYIFEQIKMGLIECRIIGKLPVLVGLIAWDGSFVLLDKDDKVIDDKIFSLDNPIDFNTFKNENSSYIEKAECFLMLSDYFDFLLTGRKQCEYTNLIPRKLISWDTKDWDDEYIEKLGFKRSQFPPLSHPGSVIGNLNIQVTEEVGYDFILIQPASRKASAAILKMHNIQDTYKKEDTHETDQTQAVQATGKARDAEDTTKIVDTEESTKTMDVQNSDKKDKINNDGKTDIIHVADQTENIQETAKTMNEEKTDKTMDEEKSDKIMDEVKTDKTMTDGKTKKIENVHEIDKTEDAHKTDNIADELKAAIGSLCIMMIISHELKDFVDAKECIRKTFY